MLPLEKNSALQLLHMRGHVLSVLADWPCGHMIDPGWSIEQIENHVAPIVSGLPAHEAALEAGLRTLAEVCRFGSTERPDESQVLAAAIQAFREFIEKKGSLCPVNVH